MRATGAERLDKLESFFREHLQENRIQGAAYIVWKDGETLAEQAMGKRTCREDSDDLRLDSIGLIYEATFPFTAAAVMQLIEQGKLSLHQPVADFLPAFDRPYFRSITVFHLLTHTSGLVPNPYTVGDVYALPNFEWHATFKGDWLQTVLSFPLRHPPGERCLFSSAGYSVLGTLIECASGMRYERYVEQHILRPLDMQDTFFDVPEDKKNRVSYAFDWQAWTINGSDPRMPRSATGLFSSVPDLLKFGRMLLDEGTLDGVRILSRRSVRLMTGNRLAEKDPADRSHPGENIAYGFGLQVADGIEEPVTPGTYGQSSTMSGFRVDPSQRLIFAFHVPLQSWDFTIANIFAKALAWSVLEGRSGTDEAPALPSESLPLIRDRLQTNMQAAVDRGSLQAAGCLIAERGGDELAAKQTFGQTVFGGREDRPADGDAIWFVTSLNKLLTAVSVLQLTEDGRLHLQQPVKSFVPEFDNAQHGGITILQLLQHTSGLAPEPGTEDHPEPNGWWEYRFLHEGDRSWVKAVLTGPLRGTPSRTRLYSTAGYLVLGEVIARVSGVSYEQYVAERILRPLGMNETFFEVPPHLRHRVVVGDEWQEALLEMPRKAGGEPPRSGSGFYSTLEDLRKLGAALLSGGTVTGGARIFGGGTEALLRRNDWFGVPGLYWEESAESRVEPSFAGAAPAKRLPVPMPYYHDEGVSASLLLDRERRSVSVVATSTSMAWSPEPLTQALNVIRLG